jgi:1-acyl-sn-glycerol-3-phosphate acyltransferase
MKVRDHKRLRHIAILRAAREASRLSISLVAEYHLEAAVKIPQPAIFIAPHRGMFDVPLGIQTFHRLNASPLLVVSRAHLEMLRVPASNWDALDLLPISRDSEGRSSLLTAGAEALANGRSVAIMPEGRVIRGPSRSDNVRSGAAALAARTSTPVVVLGSAGAEQFWQRRRPTTFVNANRKPVVALVHDVIDPDRDVESTRDSIASALTAAEIQARARLASLQEN